MTIMNFTATSNARRNPDMICWRVSAIYRCCLRLDMSKEWALEKLREISPEGHRDHMADIWFAGMENARRYYNEVELGMAPTEDTYEMAA